jgi:hypothetical protein
MNNLQFLLLVSFFLAITFTSTTLTHAQATRTWISGVGDDVNPCSRTAPCKTFAGAISKTARGGEINVLDPGGFGSVTITKSITIDGTGPMASILASGTTGIIINITDTADIEKTVRIRGISINGATSSGERGIQGIKVVAANKVSIEETVIDGFKGDGINVTGATQVFVKDTTIRNSGKGISVQSAKGQAIINNVSIVFNEVGLETISGGTIISLKNNALYGNKKDGEPTSSIPLK